MRNTSVRSGRPANVAGAADVPAGMLGKRARRHRTGEYERAEYGARNGAQVRTKKHEPLHDSLPGGERIGAARTQRALPIL